MPIDYDLVEPSTTVFEIKPEDQAIAWEQSRRFSSPSSQWRGYINHLCAMTLLRELQEDAPHLKSKFSWPNMQTIWEYIDGIPLEEEGDLFLFIPFETVDQDSFSIPQEWLDTEAWAAHYYCPIEVNLEAQFLVLSGYLSYQEVKQWGRWERRDRTYQIDLELCKSWSVLEIYQEMGEVIATPEVAALPHLSMVQANHLIERLGRSELLFPRLEIPFEQWGALITHGGWRQQLTERRWGIQASRSLLDWVETGLSQWVESLGWSRLQLQMQAEARGETTALRSILSKSLVIKSQPYELRISRLAEYENGVRFELRCLTTGAMIPVGYQLRLLTGDLQSFEGNEAIADAPVESLQVDVLLSLEDVIVWEISPQPEQFDYEIFTV